MLWRPRAQIERQSVVFGKARIAEKFEVVDVLVVAMREQGKDIFTVIPLNTYFYLFPDLNTLFFANFRSFC